MVNFYWRIDDNWNALGFIASIENRYIFNWNWKLIRPWFICKIFLYCIWQDLILLLKSQTIIFNHAYLIFSNFSLNHFIILFENILFKRYFSNNYFIILRWYGLMCHVAWCFIFLEKYDQATVTIKHRCWHQLVLDMTWYEDEFDFNTIKQRCQINNDVIINWFLAWNDKKMDLILLRSSNGVN